MLASAMLMNWVSNVYFERVAGLPIDIALFANIQVAGAPGPYFGAAWVHWFISVDPLINITLTYNNKSAYASATQVGLLQISQTVQFDAAKNIFKFGANLSGGSISSLLEKKYPSHRNGVA
jgi:hypothetical protein